MQEDAELRRLAEAARTPMRSALPVGCVRYWSDACQDQHYESAADHVPVRGDLLLSLLDRLAAAERVVEAADKAHKLRTGARDRVMAFGLGASNLPPPVHAITDHLIAENELVETLDAYRAATETQQ